MQTAIVIIMMFGITITSVVVVDVDDQWRRRGDRPSARLAGAHV